MPGKAEHIDAALLVACGVALWNLRDMEWDAALVQSLGCLAGGRIGGVLPDVLEPAISSWHRKSFHSVSALSAAASLPHWARELIEGWREEARTCRSRRMGLAPGKERSDLAWRELLLWFLVGFVLGFAAGYASHLLLDSRTPRGLRFI